MTRRKTDTKRPTFIQFLADMWGLTQVWAHLSARNVIMKKVWTYAMNSTLPFHNQCNSCLCVKCVALVNHGRQAVGGWRCRGINTSQLGVTEDSLAKIVQNMVMYILGFCVRYMIVYSHYNTNMSSPFVLHAPFIGFYFVL